MNQQLQTIFGTAGSRAAVRVADRQGEIVAETTADAAGDWRVEANVTIGASVRADVTNNGGRQVTSDWLEIVEQVAAEPEETAEDRELKEAQEAETAECRARLEGYYVDLVCALADGRDGDFEYATDLLAALGRSLDEFERDVTEMQMASRLRFVGMYSRR